MKFGSLVDCLMTNREQFNNIYAVADIPETPETMVPVLSSLLNDPEIAGVTDLSAVNDTVILKALNENGVYQNNWSPTTKAEKVRKAITEIFNISAAVRGKEVVSTSTYEKAVGCVNALYESFPEVFGPKQESHNGELTKETLFQLKFRANYIGVPVRCMPDVIKVNHNTKTVTIYDIKTCHYPEYEFYRAFIQNRYDIQAEEYWWNVRYNLDNDPYFKEFTLTDFQFVVVNPDNPQPLQWVWEKDKITPDGNYGSQRMVRLKKWNALAKELWGYITSAAALPSDINPVRPNSLIDAINNVYV